MPDICHSDLVIQRYSPVSEMHEPIEVTVRETITPIDLQKQNEHIFSIA